MPKPLVKSDILRVRVLRKELAAWKRLARADGMTLSTWVRDSLNMRLDEPAASSSSTDLVDGEARIQLCRRFITEMALLARQTAIGPLDETRLHILHEIHEAARDLILPEWYPLKEDQR